MFAVRSSDRLSLAPPLLPPPPPKPLPELLLPLGELAPVLARILAKVGHDARLYHVEWLYRAGGVAERVVRVGGLGGLLVVVAAELGKVTRDGALKAIDDSAAGTCGVGNEFAPMTAQRKEVACSAHGTARLPGLLTLRSLLFSSAGGGMDRGYDDHGAVLRPSREENQRQHGPAWEGAYMLTGAAGIQ